MGQPLQATTGPITRYYEYDSYGMPARRKASVSSVVFQHQYYRFNAATGNLTSRSDYMRGVIESFGYDKLNRLVSIYQNNGMGVGSNESIAYLDNGNITSTSSQGDYEYNYAGKPYALTDINNERVMPINGHIYDQFINYTSFKRPSDIMEYEARYSSSPSIGNPSIPQPTLRHKTNFSYNAAGERVKMQLQHYLIFPNTSFTRYYIGGNYELDETASSATERLYLGGDAYSAPAVFIKKAGEDWKIHYICRDYLGSITHVTDHSGAVLQELSYDPWGGLRDPISCEASGSETLLGRGYTGHEHLAWSGLINMNARLYDPVAKRFLSPDPYVQAPDFTQNYNRYSYCLNNPLKYTDPSGEIGFAPILLAMAYGAIIGAATSAAIYSVQVAVTGQQWNWGNFGMAVGMGAVGGALGGGLGALGGQLGTFGQSIGYNILSNVASNSATTMAFGGEITAGSMVGMVAGGLLGAGIGNFSGVNGGSLKNGIAEIGFGIAKGSVTGAAGGGVGAAINGRNIGEGMKKGAINGMISGGTVAALNIAAMGTAYKPSREYGNFGKDSPVYRRGTFLTRLFAGEGTGIAIGRNLVVHKLGKYNYYRDNETGWEIDIIKYNQFLEGHETGHFVQQREMGFANFYGRIVSEYFKYGFFNSYCTNGSLEWNADSYGYSQLGTNYYK